MQWMVLWAANSSGGNMSDFLVSLLPFILMFALIYFLLIKPQQKKEKERLKMLNTVQKNDYVLTTGGVYGIVTAVKDNELTLKIDEDNNTKVRLVRSAVVGIIRPSGQKDSNEA